MKAAETYEKALEDSRNQLGIEPERFYANPAKFDGHLRIYPTLACNLRCEYCVNEEMGCRPFKYDMASPEKWVEAINRENRHVVLTGGEPFLYPGILELINGVNPDLKLRVYSNFCLDLSGVLGKISRPVHFFISWHPQERADRDVFLANLKLMRENELLTADIHAIDAMETAKVLSDDLAFFKEHGFNIGLDSDQRTFEGAGQMRNHLAVCSKTIYLIGPDGTRFQCVSRLVRNDEPMENMLEGPLGPEEAVSECSYFGTCAPCDALGETQMAIY